MFAFIESKDIRFSDCLLWKNDVSAGFNQFNFYPPDARLMATSIDGATLIYLVGPFGWAGSSFCFDPFSRALGRLINRSITGTADIYVDDFSAMSPIGSAAQDQAVAESPITECFGPYSLSDKIDRPATHGEIIGFEVDLLRETIRPSDKAVRKLQTAFLSCDVHMRYPVRFWQIQASLAERYSHVINGMRAFV